MNASQFPRTVTTYRATPVAPHLIATILTAGAWGPFWFAIWLYRKLTPETTTVIR